MKYNGREIEIGEKIVLIGDGNREAIATYVRDEEVEIVVPVFDCNREEIRGYECYWIPVKEAEEAKKEVDYNMRTANFDKRRGTSKK